MTTLKCNEQIMLTICNVSVLTVFTSRSFRIPFPTKRTAEIVYEVLRIDEEPKRSRIKKVLSVEDNILNV